VTGDEPPAIWIVVLAFPLFFVALWLGVTTLLHHLAGWGRLMDRFPDREDRLIERVSMTSGRLGAFPAINYNNCLTLDVCDGGLRVSVLRLVGMFSRPFLVPWNRIRVARQRVFLFDYYRLSLGDPEEGVLAIRPRIARRIAQASGGKLVLPGD
jgi:hypothetical protein